MLLPAFGPALRRGGEARLQPAHGAAAQPAVRAGPAHAHGARRRCRRCRSCCRWSASATCRSPKSSPGGRCSTRSASALLVLARRYRERAERWLDRRFFRAEYDAREILMSLAGRAAVRDRPERAGGAGDPSRRLGAAPRVGGGARRSAPGQLRGGRRPPRRRAADAGRRRAADAAALVARAASRCSSTTSGRAPRGCRPRTGRGWPRPTSRCWCRCCRATPTSRRWSGCSRSGRSSPRSPTRREDRALLAAIAAQMALGLDVSRLRAPRRDRPAGRPLDDRRRRSAVPSRPWALCPRCQRCLELARGTLSRRRHDAGRRCRDCRRSSTASTASTRTSAAAAWARCSGPATCGSIATWR